MANEHRLQVFFSQPDDWIGWILMDVQWPPAIGSSGADAPGPRSSRARMSYVFCPFPELVQWMDSVARGVDPALVSWDDEGRHPRLVYESGTLFMENRGHEAWWSARIPADAVAAVFYVAFRRFVKTSYDRTRYETLHRLREVFLNQLGPGQSLTDLLLPLASMPRTAAMEAFQARVKTFSFCTLQRGPDGKLEYGRNALRFRSRDFDRWETSGRNRRLRLMKRLLNSPVTFSGSKSNLRSLRSHVIERHVLPVSSGPRLILREPEG